jgi:hypothetical protein
VAQRVLASRIKRARLWLHKREIGKRRADVSEFLD